MTKAESLEKISRIYDLIHEANKLAIDLCDAQIFVELGGPNRTDPLNQFARVQIRIETDMNTIGG